MHPANLLLIEDNTDILNFLHHCALPENYVLFTANNPKEAKKILKENNIKVILSSINFTRTHKLFFEDVFVNASKILLILLNSHLTEETPDIPGNVFQILRGSLDKKHTFLAIKNCVTYYDLKNENQLLQESTRNKLESLEIINRQIRNIYESQMIMSSTISHELRTPLSAIKMAIDIVLSGTPGNLTFDQKRFLKKAKDNIDRLKRLIDEVLDITKLEAGKTDFNFKYNNVNQTIQNVASNQEMVAKDRGLYLKLMLDESMIKIPLDEDKIIQVLNNIINNAFQFTAKGGVTISTRCYRAQNYVQIIVRDTGIGISERDIPKLFKKFSQLGDLETRKSGGSGLGLSICEQIIKSHGGKIWAESKLGKETSIIFNLPIEERRSLNDN